MRDDATGWAELVLRRYARQTNRLLAGRPFAVLGTGPHADTLVAALRAIGAHVNGPDAPDATFDAADPDAALAAASLDRPRTDAAARVAYARRHMPVVHGLAQRLARSGLLTGRRVGLCLVLEPKTAAFALALASAGAEVSLYGHPEETDQAVAEHLREAGLRVFGGDSRREDAEQEAFLAQGLHVLVDDGSRLIRRLNATPAHRGHLIGAAEETTSGLRPLRELTDLAFPVLAVNDARTKRDFDNAHGTGQSCLFTILDLLAPDAPWPLAGRRVALAGFGPVGEGFARHARALGAEVALAELDPVAELRARFAGYATGPLPELAADADLIVSATGHPHTITPAVLRRGRPDAAVAVAGGVTDEVDWLLALDAGATLTPVSTRVERLSFGTGGVLLLDRGGCINCTAGEGNPIEIMDLSFGVQLAAIELLLTADLPPGVHDLPPDVDASIARLALGGAR